MFIEIWVGIVLLVLIGAWVEYRANRSYKKGYNEGLVQAAQNTASAIANDRFFPVSLAITLVYKALLDKGLISIVRKNGTDVIQGNANSWASVEEMTLLRIKEDFFRELEEDARKSKWIRP